LATVSVLHLVDEAGDLVMDACNAADLERLARARAFFGAQPVLPGSPYGPAAVLRTGRPQVIGQLPPEVLEAVTSSDARAAELPRVLAEHTMSLPLMARGRTLGVLSLSRDTPYDDADLDHALDLSRRAALALDNASRYAFERDVAVTLQHSLLPRALTGREGLTAAARYLPGARGTRVGGDWYDVLEVDGKVVLVVGDVMGRGIEAAAVMGQLRATVRAYALEGHPPAEVLTRLDQVVLSLTGLHFSTCLVAVLDPVSRLDVRGLRRPPPAADRRPRGRRDGARGRAGAAARRRWWHLRPAGGAPAGRVPGAALHRRSRGDPGRLAAVRHRPAGRGAGRAGRRRRTRPAARVLAAQGLHGNQDDDTAVLAVLLDPAGPGRARSAAAPSRSRWC
jgi:hypothetical protein